MAEPNDPVAAYNVAGAENAPNLTSVFRERCGLEGQLADALRLDGDPKLGTAHCDTAEPPKGATLKGETQKLDTLKKNTIRLMDAMIPFKA